MNTMLAAVLSVGRSHVGRVTLLCVGSIVWNQSAQLDAEQESWWLPTWYLSVGLWGCLESHWCSCTKMLPLEATLRLHVLPS